MVTHNIGPSLLAMLLVLLLFLIPTRPVWCAPIEVWVSSTYGETTLGWGTTHFSQIQTGIDAVAIQGVVHVEPGMYFENLILQKEIYLRGAGASATVVNGVSSKAVLTVQNVEGGGIEGITFQAGLRGLDIRDTSELLVANNVFINNQEYGIQASNSEKLEITGNKVTQNGEHGIFLILTHHSLLTNNQVINKWSILMFSSWGNRIEHNELHAPDKSTISLYDGSSNNTVSGNTLSGSLHPDCTCTVIRAIGSPNNLFLGNTIRTARVGVYLGYSGASIVSDNVISDVIDVGIGLYHSSGSQILDNQITSPPIGMLLFGASSKNLIQGNTISSVGAGFALFYETNDNWVVNNSVSNSSYGVILDGVSGNTVYENNFHDTLLNSFDNGVNRWSYKTVGNHWSSYEGEDANGDNIGDVPFTITPNGKDLYPALKSFTISTQPVPTLELQPFTLRTENVTHVTDSVVWNNQTINVGQIRVTEGGSLVVRNSTIFFDDIRSGFVGIDVANGGSLEIYDSIIWGNGNEFVMHEGSSFQLVRSELYNAGNWEGGGGIKVNTSDAVIQDNRIIDTWGLNIHSLVGQADTSAKISGNIIQYGYRGLMIGGRDSVIENNIFQHLIRAGIQLAESTNTTVRENTVREAWIYGIDVINSNNNILYLNNFEARHVPARANSPNIWNQNGKGNYYSDYRVRYPNATADPSSLGNWNTPYDIIGGDNSDLYPLIEPHERQPSPDIKVNGTDILLKASPDTVVNISVSLQAEDIPSGTVDWWVVADTPFGWYAYVYPTGWQPGIAPCITVATFDLPPFEVLRSTLPKGNYIFYFGIDDNADAVPDATWFDKVVVDIM